MVKILNSWFVRVTHLEDLAYPYFLMFLDSIFGSGNSLAVCDTTLFCNTKRVWHCPQLVSRLKINVVRTLPGQMEKTIKVQRTKNGSLELNHEA